MSLCRDFSSAAVCATAADGSRATYNAIYELGVNAAGQTVLVATRYVDADGTVVDLSAATVTPGACPVYTPDIEFERLCDVQADGSFTEFMCRTIVSFDDSGQVIDPVNVAYFELDKVTPYTPTGTVGPCPECPPAVPGGVLTAWGS